ncbi:hypothetical protein [Chloroherpeton thalassium]|nr:hypothetical protein [Chloroherpeton thalassium]
MSENNQPETRFNITPDEKHLYLQIRVFQPITNDLVIHLVRAIVQTSRSHKLQKQLLDLRGIKQLQKSYQLYDPIHHGLMNFRALFKFQIAIVVSPSETPPDFIQTIFVKNGMNIKLFEDEAEALTWLDINS